MANPHQFSTLHHRFVALAAVGLIALAPAVPATAADQHIATKISVVAVNGGPDTTNPGTTCIKVITAMPAACTGGWAAIPNNNKQLVAAALMAKLTAADVVVTLNDATAQNHCPWKAFTPCRVETIEAR